MKRSQRAEKIRDAVLGEARAVGYFAWVPSGRALIVENHLWHARIHSRFNPPNGTLNLCWDGKKERFPNRMGLWLQRGPKVMSVEWPDSFDKILIRYFCRGHWEAEMFGLPPIENVIPLAGYKLYRHRSRRW